ncbi:ribose-phosphate pyrophosphokinase [Marinobacterium mangrovicola]|uniref:ribose-phosphate diphosphokinase n=1 Tax=Marinobacterium mangrovicola TaxID=1476959 RepID=A0A4R1GFZ8_9GAMM|nr:ribose-phosphate pyrophosphokinase [Marinobacterium mangrovicola]TCK07367.1 ribose-phosphate pyrophosphokinase [Marinobacterium mangrovicola]
MQPLLFNLDADPDLGSRLRTALDAIPGELEQRHFPDGESYLRVHSDPAQRDCLILCNLYRPDNLTLRLLFLADTLRELGANRVGLITPYLPYMRQDKRFHAGECVSSRPFARLLSSSLDLLVTVDPHLHRYDSLDDIYTLKSSVVHAAPMIAEWISQQVESPLLIGPDGESEQWVSEVARLAGAPFQVLTKERRGDYDVSVSLPEVDKWRSHTPVLVDDIISSGRTMLEALKHLQAAGLPRAQVIAVHGLFATDAWQQLEALADVVTCESVPHPSNGISLAKALADATLELLEN